MANRNVCKELRKPIDMQEIQLIDLACWGACIIVQQCQPMQTCTDFLLVMMDQNTEEYEQGNMQFTHSLKNTCNWLTSQITQSAPGTSQFYLFRLVQAGPIVVSSSQWGRFFIHAFTFWKMIKLKKRNIIRQIGVCYKIHFIPKIIQNNWEQNTWINMSRPNAACPYH